MAGDRTPAHCLEPRREPWQASRRGLAVALAEALAERGGVWFGWSGETVEREPRGVRLVKDGEVEFALADLTQAEHEGYYLGYANRALWPVFHYRVDLAYFDEAEFAAYEVVNRRFGRLLADLARPACRPRAPSRRAA